MIEPAKIEQAVEIAQVVRDSIISCVTDHQNEPEAITQWLENKTADNLRTWIEQNYSLVFKSDETTKIQGFILVSPKGEILLNYIHSDCQGQGIGKQLLDRVKTHYRNQGDTHLLTESTLTAKAFYLKNGFSLVEDIYDKQRLIAHRMILEL